MLICNVLSANVAGSGRVVLQHTRGARSGVIVTEKSVSFCGTMAILSPKGMKTAIVTEKSQLFSVTIVSWHPTTGGGPPDRSASSPARRMSGAPPKKSIFLKKHNPKSSLEQVLTAIFNFIRVQFFYTDKCSELCAKN